MGCSVLFSKMLGNNNINNKIVSRDSYSLVFKSYPSEFTDVFWIFSGTYSGTTSLYFSRRLFVSIPASSAFLTYNHNTMSASPCQQILVSSISTTSPSAKWGRDILGK